MRDIAPRFHTSEHILTGVVGKLFGGRIVDSRFKENKCRCDYKMPMSVEPDLFAHEIEAAANAIIARNPDVTFEFVPPAVAAQRCSLHRIPENQDVVRLVKVGDEIVTPCIGQHVANTGEIGGKIKIKTVTPVSPDTVRVMFGLE